jgi:hypothetical protein
MRVSDDHDNEEDDDDDDNDKNNNNTLLILGLVHDPSPFYQTVNIELPQSYTHIN